MNKSLSMNAGDATATPRLVLFYDGKCPFCKAEMQRLQKWDRAERLGFEDIAHADFNPDFLGVDMQALRTELHSQCADGRVLVGVDSILCAYTLVNKGWLVWPLRVALLRPVWTRLYRAFARNRYRISHWLGYGSVPACDNGVCGFWPDMKK